MSKRTVFVAGLLLLVPHVWVAAAAADAPELITLSLPKGDPEAGRAAFQKLGCIICHRVVGEDFPKPTSATPGPTLGGFLGRQSAAEVGMSIFDPSHEIRAVVRGNGKKSPMSDFTEVITVGQFVDVIAYLQSLR